MSNPKFIRRKPAARYLSEVWGLPMAPATLAKLAVIGGGPVFHRAGRIPLYSIESLDQYATARLGKPMHSTSEASESEVE
jgi:hypothetical protein